ncbi:MAG: hypothetical protein LBN08_00265 [Lactobacillales bacterium]|jgi:hypothetical protein|nr:hypothetical protein [Lactobacillales bacterium]
MSKSGLSDFDVVVHFFLAGIFVADDRAHFVVVKTDKFYYPNTLKRFIGK